MLSQLRTQLLISSLLTIAIVLGLLLFILLERFNLNTRVTELIEVEHAGGQAIELSLYVQYNAHDTNAYALGHLEHRQEFVEHAAAFDAVVTDLQQDIDVGILEEDEQAVLDQIRDLRGAYNQAAEALFVAADANRTSPSGANQAEEDAAWEVTDQLGDQLDGTAQLLAEQIHEDVDTRAMRLAARNQRIIALLIVLGLAISGLLWFIQWAAAGAVGAPLQALLTGVQQVAAGDLGARVMLKRRDEVGALANAFNTMTATLQRQTQDLQAQYATAHAAQAEAEAARAAVTDQLATIAAQQDVIREMSVPILPMTDTTFVMPLIGSLDSARLRLVQERALHALEKSTVRYLILDITGVPIIDTQVGQGLLGVIQAAQLLGTQVVLVGIRPEVAQTIVGLGMPFERVVTRSSLQSGINYTLQGR